MLLIGRNFAISIILGSVVLPRSSKEEKAEDCTKGKQYWSKSFLNPKGTCAPCPPYWKSCYNEPINDHKRCVHSCRALPKRTPPKTEPNKITTTTFPSKPSKLPSTTPTSTPGVHTSSLVTVVNPSLKNLNKAKVNKNLKPGVRGEEKGPKTIIAITVFTVLFLALLAVLIVLLVQSRRKRGVVAERQDPEEAESLPCLLSDNRVQEEALREDQGEEILHCIGNEENGPSQIDAPPVQATISTSALSVDGIQDTEEDKGASSVSLLKESHV